MKIILPLALCLLLVSCGVQKPQVIIRDSIRVEYKEKIVKVPDTTYVPIEREVIKNVTTDTFSTVETRYAISTAVVSKGMLFHNIQNKAGNIVVPTDKEIIYRDSIIYQDRYKEMTKYVNQPTRWQKFKMRFFYIFVFGVVGWIGGKMIKIYIKK